jgi:enoyl-CoA hydratase/carnithine racemase
MGEAVTESLELESEAIGPVKPVLASSGPAEPVAYECDGKVVYLTMQQRPHNFLGIALINGLIDGARRAVAEGARAVVVRSSLRNFCAGADINLFDTAYEGRAPEVDLTTFLTTFDELPIPIVAAIHGVCVGGGLEVALACDLIIAAQSARIGSVEATIAVNPLMGAMQRVTQRAGATRAKEMALLGRRYDARTLERWNLINRVVPDERLTEVTRTIAEELAHGPTVAHASSKAIISLAASEGVREADRRMAELQEPIWSSSDIRLGLQSLAENGPGAARFEGK